MNRRIEVWLYIGAMLSLYGALLTAAGVYQLSHPPHTVLAREHAVLWAGVILLAVGLGYVARYWPRRRMKTR